MRPSPGRHPLAHRHIDDRQAGQQFEPGSRIIPNAVGHGNAVDHRIHDPVPVLVAGREAIEFTS